jgi:copper homeostasis protein (lipoprotein)
MRLASIVLSMCLLLPMAACERDRSAAGMPQPAPPLQQSDGRIEWEGLLPCADCDGIQTSLVLERSGDARRFSLVETYLAEDGARFIEAGQWRSRRGLLELQAEGGAHRVYGLLPDGRLQPRDARGRPYAGRQGDFLVPVTVGNPP